MSDDSLVENYETCRAFAGASDAAQGPSRLLLLVFELELARLPRTVQGRDPVRGVDRRADRNGDRGGKDGRRVSRRFRRFHRIILCFRAWRPGVGSTGDAAPVLDGVFPRWAV